MIKNNYQEQTVFLNAGKNYLLHQLGYQNSGKPYLKEKQVV